jgi:predicted ABC-type ATPase
MRTWKVAGYHIALHFIELPSEDFAVRRVAMRVAAGGHDVPEADVRRRYHRGLALFEHVYKRLVDEWYHWYSDEGGLNLGRFQKR